MAEQTCTHDSGTRWASEPDKRMTYPEALSDAWERFDRLNEEQGETIDLLVLIAQGRIESPRAAVVDFLQRHYPDGPDLQRLA